MTGEQGQDSLPAEKFSVVSVKVSPVAPLTVSREQMRLLASLPRLTYLHLGGGPVNVNMDESAFAELAQLRPLSTLAVSVNALTDDWLRHLSGLNGLEHLHLLGPGMKLDGRGFSHLQPLGKLRTLSFQNLKLSGEALAHLKPLPKLDSLGVCCAVSGSTEIGDVGAAHIAQLPRLSQLTLQTTGMTGQGLAKICGGCTELTYLRTEGHKWRDADLAPLEKLSKLEILYLGDPEITDEGLVPLAKLSKLRELWIPSTGVRGPGLSALKALPQFEKLSMDGDKVSNETLRHIAALPHLTDLTIGVYFGAGQVTDEGLVHLRALQQLKLLKLDRTGATEAGVKKLRTALPKCEVTLIPLKVPSKEIPKKEPPKTATADPDRAAAEWAIRRGGVAAVSVDSRNVLDIKQVAELPAESFSLMHVEFSGKPITDDELAVLRGLKRLSGLALRSTDVTDKGLEQLSSLDSLGLLMIEGTKVTSEGLAHVAKLKKLDSLGCPAGVTDAGAKHLTGLKQLRTLFLDNAEITGTGLAELCAALPKLDKLSLNGCQKLADGDLAHLSKAPSLREVLLDRTSIADKGLEHIGKLKGLKVLYLSGTKVTDDGLKHLHGLAQLEQIVLTDTEITKAGVERLKMALPKCTVTGVGK